MRWTRYDRYDHYITYIDSLTSSREKRLTLYVLAFTCLFTIMMWSSASDELETDFVPDTRTQSLSPPLQPKSDERISKQYGEFIQQQAVQAGTKSPKINVLLTRAFNCPPIWQYISWRVIQPEQ